MDPFTVVLALATLGGFYMAWNIGANDVANAMGTSVGSGALTLRRAVMVAAVFELAGALLAGGSVTQTISKGIVDVSVFSAEPLTIAIGMTCSVVAAAMWIHIATLFGWPVSTTHSIVGAVLGFGLSLGGLSIVSFPVLGKIAASWVVSPVLGGVIGYVSYRFIRARILGAKDPRAVLTKIGPLLLFPVFTALALAIVFKGLKPLRLDLGFQQALPIALGIAAVLSVTAVPFLRRANNDDVERVFIPLQIVTACCVAFAHGSNDVANAVGPMAAVYAAANDTLTSEVSVPINVLLVGAIGIVIGLATFGHRVMATIGKEITELSPSRGFSAEFGAAVTILLASKLGMPVSTTHTLVGAVVGVGIARSPGAINTRVLRGIVASWLITVPFSAALAAFLFVVARLLF